MRHCIEQVSVVHRALKDLKGGPELQRLLHLEGSAAELDGRVEQLFEELDDTAMTKGEFVAYFGAKIFSPVRVRPRLQDEQDEQDEQVEEQEEEEQQQEAQEAQEEQKAQPEQQAQQEQQQEQQEQ